MSIRLVHGASAMNAPMNTAPFGDQAASTAAHHQRDGGGVTARQRGLVVP
jgi:hypothetical protein